MVQRQSGRRALRGRSPGQATRRSDVRLLQRAVAYGGDYFEKGQKVGKLGTTDPGPSTLDSPEAIEAAKLYKKLIEIAHPGSTSWDWNDLGEAFGAEECAMCPEWHEFA